MRILIGNRVGNDDLDLAVRRNDLSGVRWLIEDAAEWFGLRSEWPERSRRSANREIRGEKSSVLWDGLDARYLPGTDSPYAKEVFFAMLAERCSDDAFRTILKNMHSIELDDGSGARRLERVLREERERVLRGEQEHGCHFGFPLQGTSADSELTAALWRYSYIGRTNSWQSLDGVDYEFAVHRDKALWVCGDNEYHRHNGRTLGSDAREQLPDRDSRRSWRRTVPPICGALRGDTRICLFSRPRGVRGPVRSHERR